jgi:branched-chain amino acid transport system ATP-binding protein
MISPQLLLLDEPSLGVSPIMTDKIFAILKELNRNGTAILMTEQNAEIALEISKKGYVLQTGKIIHEDSSSQLISSDLVRKSYLGIEGS